MAASPRSASHFRIPMPREHGTYGMLGIPLVVALASGGPRLASLALALGAVAGFLAHESLLIVIGQRGQRLRTNEGAVARNALRLLGGAALVFGAVGFFALASVARGWLALPIGLAVVMAGLVALGRERTTGGEVVASVGLSAWAVPVAVAGGVPVPGALCIWAVFGAGYVVSTLAVRAVILSHKPRATPALRILTCAVSVGFAVLGFLVARGLGLSVLLPLALLGFCAMALVLAARPPHPRNLERIGWSSIAVSVLTTGLVLAALA